MEENIESNDQEVLETTNDTENTGHSTSTTPDAIQHRTILSTWGIPSPVNAGETFVVNIGARCPANCSFEGMGIVVSNDKGEQVVQAKFEDKVLPATLGTYFAQLELTAPKQEDTYTWHASCAPLEAQQTHPAGAIDFSFRTSAPPEHKVSVQVITSRDKFPLETANVMLGLHRTFTNEQGVALVEVPKGKQMLRVSKQDYRSYEEEVVIDNDSEFAIELVYDPSL